MRKSKVTIYGPLLSSDSPTILFFFFLLSSDSEDEDDSDYEDTEFDGAETRTNPNASLPSRTSFSGDSSDESSDSSDDDQDGNDHHYDYGHDDGIATHHYGDKDERDSSSSDSESDSSDNVNSTSVGADDELAPARKPFSPSVPTSGSHHQTHGTQYSQHTLPSAHNELYSESDDGSDFHRNMEKFIKDYREQQANGSFKIDISDSEIEPPGRKVSAGIAATGKRPTSKSKEVKNGNAKKATAAGVVGVGNGKRNAVSKQGTKRG